jgi:sugar transport system substrate-binding protein
MILLFLAACSPFAPAGRPVVAVILTPTDPLLQAGMRAAADSSSAILKIYGPAGTLAEEKTLIEDALKQKPAALVISPLSAQGSLPALGEVVSAGVPVICYETCVNQAGVAAAFLSGPNRDLGALSAEAALEFVAGSPGGKAVLGVFPCAQAPACELRRSEFLSRFRQAPAVEVIEAQPGADEPAAVKFLQDNPQVSLLWAAGDGETRSAVAAIQALGLAQRVALIGAGLDEETLRLVESQSMLRASAAPLLYQSGYDVVSAALTRASGGAAPDNPRKSALLISVTTQNTAREYLSSQGHLMLPTPPPLIDSGAGIKPSCGCSLTPQPATPTPP